VRFYDFKTIIIIIYYIKRDKYKKEINVKDNILLFFIWLDVIFSLSFFLNSVSVIVSEHIR